MTKRKPERKIEYPPGWEALGGEDIRQYAKAGEAILRETGSVPPNSLASFAIARRWREENTSGKLKVHKGEETAGEETSSDD